MKDNKKYSITHISRPSGDNSVSIYKPASKKEDSYIVTTTNNFKNRSKILRNINYYYIIIRKFILLLIFDNKEKIASKTIRTNLLILAIFFGIFTMWGIFAPINSAIIAPGGVILDFNKKTIQHLEGGLIEEILVKEDQEVVTGQDLIYLQDIHSKAKNKMLKKQFLTAKAKEIRLKAEQDKLTKVNFTDLKNQYKEETELYSELLDIIQTQEDIFITSLQKNQNKIKILNKNLEQLQNEIKGLNAERKATNDKLKILNNQCTIFKELVKQNNYPRSKLLEIEKEIADTEGIKGSLDSNLAKTEQEILKTKLKIIDFNDENQNQILAQLEVEESKISDLTEQLISSKDVLKRTVIKSPTSGKVINLKYYTVGAVIPPGGEIMSIIPQDDELIVEAKVKPQDIDLITKNLKAKVQLTAYKSRKIPKLDGEVLSVSADALQNEITGEKYFLSRIKIDQNSIKKLKEKIKLYPGMQANVFIITGSRSLFDYLFTPLENAGYKAFRED